MSTPLTPLQITLPPTHACRLGLALALRRALLAYGTAGLAQKAHDEVLAAQSAPEALFVAGRYVRLGGRAELLVRMNLSLVEAALMRDGLQLSIVPEEDRSEVRCRLATRQDGVALQYVPEALRTEELIRATLERCGQALIGLPEAQWRPEWVELALPGAPALLRYVPPEVEVSEPTLAQVLAQRPDLLAHIPERRRTAALCATAVCGQGQMLLHVPLKEMTRELCRLAVAQNGQALQFVPVQWRSDELAATAVAQNGEALAHVPPNLVTRALCLAAVKQRGAALVSVPDPYDRDPEILRAAVAQDPAALSCVEKNQRTLELCRLALEAARGGDHLGRVPEELFDQAVEQALPKNPGLLLYLGEKHPLALRADAALWRAAVAAGGWELGRLSKDRRAQVLAAEVVDEALAKNPDNLRYWRDGLFSEAQIEAAVAAAPVTVSALPAEMRRPEWILAALRTSRHAAAALFELPREHFTPEFCRLAVEATGAALQYLPPEERTLEICELAVREASGALAAVPRALWGAAEPES